MDEMIRFNQRSQSFDEDVKLGVWEACCLRYYLSLRDLDVCQLILFSGIVNYSPVMGERTGQQDYLVIPTTLLELIGMVEEQVNGLLGGEAAIPHYYPVLVSIGRELLSAGISSKQLEGILTLSLRYQLERVKCHTEAFLHEDAFFGYWIELLKEGQADYRRMQKAVASLVNKFVKLTNAKLETLVSASVDAVQARYGRLGLLIARELGRRKSSAYASESEEGLRATLQRLRAIDSEFTEKIVYKLIRLLRQEDVKKHNLVAARFMNCVLRCEEFDLRKDEITHKRRGVARITYLYKSYLRKRAAKS